MKKLSRRVLRRLKHLALLLLMALAACLTAGRLLTPLLPTQTEAVEAQLSKLLNAEVTIGEMRGEWFRFGPILAINDLQIRTLGQDQVHRIGRIELSLNTSASLLRQQVVVETLSIADLSFGLQQQSDGRWGLAGVPVSDPGNPDVIIDFLLQARDININEADISLQRNDGRTVALGSIFLNVQNRGTSHEAQLQLRVNGQQSPAHAVLQLEGDPRTEFNASAWLDSDQLDWLPLARSVLPSEWQWQQLQGVSRLWVNVDSRGLQGISGVLEDVQVEAAHTDGIHKLSVQSGALAFNARPQYGADTVAPGWNLQIENMHFDWQNLPHEVGALQISTDPGNVQFRLRAAELDLDMLSQVLAVGLPMPERASTAVQTLAAKGFMRNVHVDTALDGSYPQGFLLRGNLADVSVAAWQQAPSGSGINAYLEANAVRGMAEVDSKDFTIHLPHLFASPWHYDSINTRVYWDVTPDEVKVQSTIIDVSNASLDGRVRFDLHNYRDGEGAWLNDFSLQVGMQRMDATAAKVYLPTLQRLRSTMDWLDTALQGGELGQSAFVLRTLSGRNAPPQATQAASWYRVTGGRLQFLPDWPTLENIDAGVVVRNNDVDIVARSGTLAGMTLDDARAKVRPAQEGGAVLSLVAHSTTDTPTGLTFLKTTPVHDKLGTFLDNWQAAGMLDVNVGLGVDLRDRTRQPEIRVGVVTTDSTLDMTNYDLELTGINGTVNYSNGGGLEAMDLTASLFDFPIEADITTAAAATPQETLTIRGQGSASVTALQNWSGQPEFVRQLFGHMQGEIDYETTLVIEPQPGSPQRQTRLLIESSLLGLSSDLPLPLSKSADERRILSVELGFSDGLRSLNLQYQDWLNGALILDAEGIERGQISVGNRNRNFNVRQSDRNAAGVLVTGDLDSFDVPAWDSIARELNRAGGDGRAVSDYMRLVDVNVGELVVPGRTLENINVVVEHPDDAWRIRARNEFLAGELLMPDSDTQPWDVTLEYLRFPPRPVVEESTEVEEVEEVDPLQDVDPTTMPAFNFSTTELSVGPDNLGSFSFQFRPHRFGANVTNFRMQSPDSSIMDTTGTFGANIEWSYQAGTHNTKFTGVFAAGDLSKVLPAWGHDPHVVSEVARFDSVLQWPGSPLHFALKRVSGTVNMDIDDGRFVEINSNSTRLLGALNFDALIRRLQLDFSDIFATGYSFDSIDGFLTFTNGVVDTTNPLTIDGPSSDITINGEINLEQETIAADMQVQIPIGQNVSMVAGLLGAWPIAVSTYIASKILQESVDDFATVVYRLEGPWDDPTAGFETPAEESTNN